MSHSRVTSSKRLSGRTEACLPSGLSPAPDPRVRGPCCGTGQAVGKTGDVGVGWGPRRAPVLAPTMPPVSQQTEPSQAWGQSQHLQRAGHAQGGREKAWRGHTGGRSAQGSVTAPASPPPCLPHRNTPRRQRARRNTVSAAKGKTCWKSQASELGRGAPCPLHGLNPVSPGPTCRSPARRVAVSDSGAQGRDQVWRRP